MLTFRTWHGDEFTAYFEDPLGDVIRNVRRNGRAFDEQFAGQGLLLRR